MKIIPLFIEKRLDEPLNYNFGVLYPITSGEWELCIKSLGIIYNQPEGRQPAPPLDKFIRLSCNYVESLSLDSSETQSITAESILSLLHLKLKVGEKKIFEFCQRDYFFVSSPSQKLQFHILNSDATSLAKDIAKNLEVKLLILFRRRT